MLGKGSARVALDHGIPKENFWLGSFVEHLACVIDIPQMVSATKDDNHGTYKRV